MAVPRESLDRLREDGRRSAAGRPAGEMAAFEHGRDDMLSCVASSWRLSTRGAVERCERKLRR